MKISYQLALGFPKLAWLADCDANIGRTTVLHGTLVEIRDNFFVEGIWNGPFGLGRFGETDCFFGTGAVLTDRGIRFVSSAATTDYLYYSVRNSRIFVSNSLPLLLAGIGDELVPEFVGYSRINESIIRGIDEYIEDLPTRGGTVKRLIVRNLDVSSGRVEKVDKILPPHFGMYADYRAYLNRNYELIANNARDPGRSHRLGIYSTQSQGYDTTAANSIAREYGIDAVFTVTKGKGRDHFADTDANAEVDDDGTQICERLGLKSIPIDRRAFEKEYEEEAEETLYLSALDNNCDANLLNINRLIPQSAVLVTGVLGEIFYPSSYFHNREPYACKDLSDTQGPWPLQRGDLGMHGLTEVRLVVGFIQLPLFYVGARRFSDIVRITESEEMNPWRLGSFYDRPIARRIAEEAGIPREFFGQIKKASTVEFCPPYAPYGKKLRAEYFAFLTQNRLLAGWKTWLFPLAQKINALLLFYSPAHNAGLYYVHRILAKLTGRVVRFPIIWEQLNGSVFCFGVNRRIESYKKALGEISRGSMGKNGRLEMEAYNGIWRDG